MGWGGRAEYPMPMVRTCSAATSAACHRHEEDVDAHLMPLTWGFVPEESSQRKALKHTDLKGRFCFTTAANVQWPKPR
jgi:hypothetical protein